MGVGLHGVRLGVSNFQQIALQSHSVSVMALLSCLIFFDYSNFGEGCPWGSTMAPLHRELSHRLSIQTTRLPGTVWPQFAMHVLTGGLLITSLGKGWSYGVVIGFLSSPVTTSYRLPIVTI